MNLRYYLQTYLFDIIGMEPGRAVEHLKTSPARDYFRSMRVVHDVPFDPKTNATWTNPVTGVEIPAFVEEEFAPGRVTVKVEDGLITKAMLEYAGFTREWVREAQWPPPQPDEFGLYKGEVFVLGDPVPLGKRGVRREILSFPETPVRTRETPWGTGETIDPPARTGRGWFLQGIESLFVVNRPLPVGERVPPPKPRVQPRFEPVPW